MLKKFRNRFRQWRMKQRNRIRSWYRRLFSLRIASKDRIDYEDLASDSIADLERIQEDICDEYNKIVPINGRILIARYKSEDKQMVDAIFVPNDGSDCLLLVDDITDIDTDSKIVSNPLN